MRQEVVIIPADDFDRAEHLLWLVSSGCYPTDEEAQKMAKQAYHLLLDEEEEDE